MAFVLKNESAARRVALRAQVVQPARGVADRFDVHLHPVQHRHPEVVERRVPVVTNMTPLLDGSAAAAGQQDRKVVVVVGVPSELPLP